MGANSMVIKDLETVYKELEDDNVDLQTKYQYSEKKTGNRVKNMSLGRIWLNIILPEKFDLVDEPVDKKVCNKIFSKMLKQFGPEIAADILTKLNKETFKLSTIAPVTFSSETLVLSEEIKKQKQELSKIKDPVEFAKKQKEVGENFVKELIDKDDGMGNMTKSGIGKVNPIDLSVLLISKGSTVDIEGNISDPITSGVSDGFNLKEYHLNAGEARRNLYIRSIGAAKPGAIAREISYAVSGVILSRDDCKTRKYFELNGKEYYDIIMGRYWLNPRNNKEEMITSDTKLPAGTIKLRSPLYCRDKKGICKVCYGDMSNIINNKNIGLVAANVVGKIGIEVYSMKARHKSTQINIEKTNFKNDLIK